MTETKVGGIIFLIVSIIYGLMAYDIPLLFEENSPFTSRTLPFFLAIAGIIVSFLIIVVPAPTTEAETLAVEKTPTLAAFRNKDWKSILFLSILMLAYGASINYLGFILSTSLFLIAGFFILNERRIRVMLLGAIPLVLIFWFLMTEVLGLYLAPGSLFVR